MRATNFFVSTSILASSFSTQCNLQALHDISESAVLLGSASEIIPIPNSTSRSADYYLLKIYLEFLRTIIFPT